MIKCAIVDDEHLAIMLLEEFVKKAPQLKLVGTARNATQTLELLDKTEVDLLFLDINMPDLSGLELIRTIKSPPLFILTTAYTEYALDSYELNAVDYLLKPIAFERFMQAVHKAEDLVKLKQMDPGPGNGKTEVSEDKQFIFVKSDYKWMKINFDDILYIEGLREYVSIYLKSESRERIITLESMKHLSEILPSKQFLRIHRSFIVSLNDVSSIAGSQLEIDGKTFPIGKSYKDQVLRHFRL